MEVWSVMPYYQGITWCNDQASMAGGSVVQAHPVRGILETRMLPMQGHLLCL